MARPQYVLITGWVQAQASCCTALRCTADAMQRVDKRGLTREL